jgi:hypothetical protein
VKTRLSSAASTLFRASLAAGAFMAHSSIMIIVMPVVTPVTFVPVPGLTA